MWSESRGAVVRASPCKLPVWLTAHEAIRRTPRVQRVWEMLAAGLKPLVDANG